MGKLLSPLLKIWWYCRNLILASAELWQATRSPTLTWNFHEKQDIMLMEVRWVMHHGSCSARWGGCKCWRSGFAKFLSFVATILLRCSQSDIGCEECYLSAISWKENISHHHHHHQLSPITISRKENISRLFSYRWAILLLCCLLRFLIKNVALIFWLAISTHRTSNIFSSQKLFHFDMKSAKIF